MTNKTEYDKEDKSAHKTDYEMKEFESFLKKKIVQTETLKKICDKLNTNKNDKLNK